MRFNIFQWGVVHGLGWVICLTDGWLIHNHFLFGVGLFFIVYSMWRVTVLTPEDEEFERIQRESMLRNASQPSRTDEQERENTCRNNALEEVAKEFEKMPFGDTAASFAIFVRGMKR
jgi:hypothetical protein